MSLKIWDFFAEFSIKNGILVNVQLVFWLPCSRGPFKKIHAEFTLQGEQAAAFYSVSDVCYHDNHLICVWPKFITKTIKIKIKQVKNEFPWLPLSPFFKSIEGKKASKLFPCSLFVVFSLFALSLSLSLYIFAWTAKWVCTYSRRQKL